MLTSSFILLWFLVFRLSARFLQKRFMLYEGAAKSSVTRAFSRKLHARFSYLIRHFKDLFFADTVMYNLNRRHWFNWSKFCHNDVKFWTLTKCNFCVLKFRLWCLDILNKGFKYCYVSTYICPTLCENFKIIWWYLALF